MLTKTPNEPLPSWPPLMHEKKHKVQDGDNWWKLADQYGRQDPWDIIQFNFNTRTPEEVNYYLEKLVGCTRSNDGKNYSISSTDSPGMIYLPPRTWDPASGPYRKTDWQDFFRHTYYGLDRSDSCPSKMSDRMLDRLRFVEVPKLPVPCEYDYQETVYVRPQRVLWDYNWILRECVHIGNGPLGKGYRFTAEAEAIAWIKINAEWTSKGKASKLPFPFDQCYRNSAWKRKMFQAAGVYRAMRNTFAAEQRFRELLAVVRQDPDSLRRMGGRPPV
ncbi:MAG: hypothetical protein JNK48_18075 [Bryobacterales bacterium]|nr:hypothetical protein [Bryobacterales bacterium]